jgi:hypothetical protein
MIAFLCPHCNVQLKVKDRLAGRMGKCPGCGNAVTVPQIAEKTPVTEAEWLAGTDPEPMLEFLFGRTTDRKLRLFACASARCVHQRLAGWAKQLDERIRRSLQVAEQFADGLATKQALSEAAAAAEQACQDAKNRSGVLTRVVGPPESIGRYVAFSDAEDAAWYTMLLARVFSGPTPLAADCDLIRCISHWPPSPARQFDARLRQCGTAQELARAAYENRRLPEGTLDPTRLALLADALEDAGCTDAGLLGHLRGPGPHVRGCWAVDLVLGKG